MVRPVSALATKRHCIPAAKPARGMVPGQCRRSFVFPETHQRGGGAQRVVHLARCLASPPHAPRSSAVGKDVRSSRGHFVDPATIFVSGPAEAAAGWGPSASRYRVLRDFIRRKWLLFVKLSRRLTSRSSRRGPVRWRVRLEPHGRHADRIRSRRVSRWSRRPACRSEAGI